MKTSRRLTARGKNLVDQIAENIGKSKPDSLGAIARRVGYSDSMSNNPQKILEGESVKAYFERMFPPDDRQKILRSLLNAKRPSQMPFYYKVADEEIKAVVEKSGFQYLGTKRFMTQAYVYFIAPDTMAVKSAFDMMAKIVGDFAPIKVQNADPFEGMSIDEIDKALEENQSLLERFRKFKPKKGSKSKSKQKIVPRGTSKSQT